MTWLHGMTAAITLGIMLAEAAAACVIVAPVLLYFVLSND